MILKKFKSSLRNNFITGVLVGAPLMIVFFIFDWVFGGILDALDAFPLMDWVAISGPAVLGLAKVLMLVVLVLALFLAICFLGFFSRLYLGRKLLELLADLMSRVPVFGPIYTAFGKLLSTFSRSQGKQFSRVVLIEYPRQDVWAVAFVTGTVHLPSMPTGYLNVYVPTVPIPTSGFHLMVPESAVRDSQLSVEEAFKLILSLGMDQP